MNAGASAKERYERWWRLVLCIPTLLPFSRKGVEADHRCNLMGPLITFETVDFIPKDIASLVKGDLTCRVACVKGASQSCPTCQSCPTKSYTGCVVPLVEEWLGCVKLCKGNC